MNKKRVRVLNKIDSPTFSGPIVYWMSREIRFYDNWALVYAHRLSQKFDQPLKIVFSLRSDLDKHFGTRRMLDFMIVGLKEVESDARNLGIGFDFLISSPEKALPKYLSQEKASALITDFSPLSTPKRWKQSLIKELLIPIYEVDAHNIIPCWELSDKQEFAAYTIRPKVHKKLDEFLDEYPVLDRVKNKSESPRIDWKKIRNQVSVRESISSSKLKPGIKQANKVLDTFLESKLETYVSDRNNPAVDGLSNLSPYLHFGNISAQRVALEVSKWQGDKESKESFLEELIVRRELAENYCCYNPEYKSFSGFPDWAKKTLNQHRNDSREYQYSLEGFEQAKTHDSAWNAAQMEMVRTGKMHGYMRMYWAKKILEWARSPEEAQEIAIYLNDLYQLDGRDPNGYTGIAWSIGGVHDRAWFERPVYGKIRYMNYNGLKRKFDIDGYVEKNMSG